MNFDFGRLNILFRNENKFILICRTILLVFVIFCFNYFNINAAKITDSKFSYISTPKGSDTKVIIKDFDLTDYTKKQYDLFVKINYPKAQILAPATNKYNSNSFSWCNRYEQYKTFNLINPVDFINDDSFTKCSLDSGVIIAYGSDYIHSGIVTEIDSSTFYVTSKWGEMGLIYHDYRDTPFLCKEYNFYSRTK